MMVLAIVLGVACVALCVAVFVVKAGAKKAAEAAMDAYARDVHEKLIEAAEKKRAVLEKRSVNEMKAIYAVDDKELEEKLNK
jgi:hypothetical protein